MKRAITILLFAVSLSGCGVIHNLLHPSFEHCRYECFEETISDKTLKGIEDCAMRETLTDASFKLCRYKCIGK